MDAPNRTGPEPRIHPSVLQRIGRTRLLTLNRILPEGCARILIKDESANPTGSMKDRMALAMIARAEADGRLQPGSKYSSTPEAPSRQAPSRASTRVRCR
jgi:threonine synthase